MMFRNMFKAVVLVFSMILPASPLFAQMGKAASEPHCQSFDAAGNVEQSICIDLAGNSKESGREEATYCSFFGQDLKTLRVSSPGVPKPFYHDFNDSVDLVTKYARVDNKKFQTRVAAVPNAAAVISRSKNARNETQEIKYLLFNQNFLTSIKGYARNRLVYKSVSKTGNKSNGKKAAVKQIQAGVRDDWLVMNVVAHEVGHHLAGHTLKLGNQPYNELQADWFAGFMLQKLGASLREAREMLTLGSPCGTLTHPERKDRLAAVASGWVQACEEDGECNIARININAMGTHQCVEEKKASVKSVPAITRKIAKQKYDLICKLRDRNYLLKDNTIFKNTYAYVKEQKVWKHVWKIDADMSFKHCSSKVNLADGARCVEQGIEKGGAILEGTLLGEAIPVGVCAPCAPGVCPAG